MHLLHEFRWQRIDNFNVLQNVRRPLLGVSRGYTLICFRAADFQDRLGLLTDSLFAKRQLVMIHALP